MVIYILAVYLLFIFLLAFNKHFVTSYNNYDTMELSP